MSIKKFCDWCGQIIGSDNREYIQIGASVHFCNEACYEKFSTKKKENLAADAGREKGRE